MIKLFFFLKQIIQFIKDVTAVIQALKHFIFYDVGDQERGKNVVFFSKATRSQIERFKFSCTLQSVLDEPEMAS